MKGRCEPGTRWGEAQCSGRVRRPPASGPSWFLLTSSTERSVCNLTHIGMSAIRQPPNGGYIRSDLRALDDGQPFWSSEQIDGSSAGESALLLLRHATSEVA
jgi:hypothetical protein